MSVRTEATGKAQQTKERIFETAMRLFAEKGYSETTLRDIAAEANISLGLTYRYFARKEDLVFELYERLAKMSAEEAEHLERGPLARRFSTTLLSCLDRLQPHRSALGSLFAVGLMADSEMAVLGDRASGVRGHMWEMYREVVSGATDSPKPHQAEQITTLIYAGHLLIILFWMQDRSEGQQRTRDLVGVAASLMKHLRPILALPIVGKTVADLHRIMLPMFGPPSANVGPA
jgi:AcrR family transcriptional regulator